MTVIRVMVAFMLLPWLLLLAGAVAVIQVLDGTFFEGVEWDD
mgnify:FL=1|jgi:hypothetical protein